jgi:hypothetical protein
MGCLSRVGCLVVLAGGAAVGFWLYGDRFPSELSRAAVQASEKAGEVSKGVVGTTPAVYRDSVRAAEKKIAWVGIGRASGAKPPSLSRLTRRNGPAYVTLGATELAALVGGAVRGQLPQSAQRLQLALQDERLLLRAAIDVSEIAGDGTLGRLLGTALAGRDSLRLAGTLDLVRPGLAQYRVSDLRVKGIDVPPRLIPTVLGALRRGERPEGLAENGVPLEIPKAVADIRLVNGRLTLYRALATP